MPTKLTPPTVEEMRQMVADADRAASQAGLDQLNDMVGSDAWLKIKAEVAVAQGNYGHDALTMMQLNSFMALITAVEALPSQVRQRIAV